MRPKRRFPILSTFLLIFLTGSLCAAGSPESRVSALIEANGEAGLRALGPDKALPEMVRLYETGHMARRVRIANLWYRLGWESSDAQHALLQDALTENPSLRVAVQYALGRVSDDPRVIETLLRTMQHDDNPFFRDKAACALTYDQIHLDEAEKVRLYEGLIQALSSDVTQVRQIAIKALSILTGQTKGYRPGGTPEKRQPGIEEWRRWLAEYKENL